MQVLCTNIVGLFWNAYISYITHCKPGSSTNEAAGHEMINNVMGSSEWSGDTAPAGVAMQTS